MVQLNVAGQVTLAGSEIFHSVSSLEVVRVDGTDVLLAASGQEGFLVAYTLGTGPLPAFNDLEVFSSDVSTGAGRPIGTTMAGGEMRLLTGQSLAGTVETISLSPSAELSRESGISGYSMHSITWFEEAADYLVTGSFGENTISLARLNGDQVQVHDTYTDTAGAHLDTLSTMTTGTLGTQSFVFTGSASEYGVSCFTIGDDSLSLADSFGQADGLGLMSPTAMEFVTLAGQGYLVIASAPSAGASGALTVMNVSEAGALVPVDHTLDTQVSRFGSVSAMDVIDVSGQIFIAAAGGDGGLSLFALAPGGQLVHLHAYEPDATAPLLGVTDLALRFDDGILEIFASTMSEAGFTVLAADLGTLGVSAAASGAPGALYGSGLRDMLSGGAGNDTLIGHGGDDILLDGDGQDTLRGGSGADLFVLSADGRTDTIADFNTSQDRIDLSDWRQLYSVEDLSITLNGTSATLTWRNETLVLMSSSECIREHILAAIDLPFTRSINPPQMTIHGDASSEVLIGEWGADTLVGNAGDDTLQGNSGSDLQEGSSGRDVLSGGDGDEWLSGGSEEDTLHGDMGRDTLHGGSHDDQLFGGEGNDTLFGDTGDDTLHGDDGDDSLEGGNGADVLHASSGADVLRAGDDDDSLYGEDGDDSLFGDAGADVLRGGNGNDSIDGGDGDDSLHADNGLDTLRGGGGRDELFGSSEGEHFDGGNDHDSIYGGGGDDTVMGGAGRDYVSTGYGDDSIDGGDGDDTIFSRQGDDIIIGGSGRDRIHGAYGNDYLEGGPGRDRLLAGRGEDTIYAGDGDDRVEGGGWTDVLFGEDGADRLLAGRGDDTVYAGDDTSNDSLAGGRGNDVMFGQDGDDTLEGGGWRDFLSGGSSRDLIQGGNSNDTLEGGSGRDTLEGAKGRDVLHGGAGDDILTGGIGQDEFVFREGGDTDVITDFNVAKDEIWVDEALWGAATTGQDLYNLFGTLSGSTMTLEFAGGDNLIIENISGIGGFCDNLLML